MIVGWIESIQMQDDDGKIWTWRQKLLGDENVTKLIIAPSSDKETLYLFPKYGIFFIGGGTLDKLMNCDLFEYLQKIKALPASLKDDVGSADEILSKYKIEVLVIPVSSCKIHTVAVLDTTYL